MSKVRINALKRIALWKPQSTYEDTEIVHETDSFRLELQRVRSGAAWLILGRKGIGKSALTHKFQAIYKDELISRKNEFDPNIIHSRLKHFDEKFSILNASKVFKLDILLLAANELAFRAADKKLKRNAKKISAFYDKKWRKSLSTSFGLSNFFYFLLSFIVPRGALDRLFKSLPEFRDGNTIETTLKQTINTMRSLFQDCKSNKPIFIIFDEIDVKLSEQKKDIGLDEYLEALRGLLGACASFDDIRQLGIPIFPIVVLRSDIYNKIEGADHNKWQASAAQIRYTENELRAILKHRMAIELARAGLNSDALKLDFKEVWASYVDTKKLLYNKTMERAVFERTLFRPRDIVQMVKLLATSAIKRPNAVQITPTDFNNSRADYAKYFLGELMDELAYIYPFAERLEDIIFDIFFPIDRNKVTYRNLAPIEIVTKEFTRLRTSVRREGYDFEPEDLINDLISRSVFGVQIRTKAGPKESYEYSSGKLFRSKDAEALSLHNAIADYFQARVN